MDYQTCSNYGSDEKNCVEEAQRDAEPWLSDRWLNIATFALGPVPLRLPRCAGCEEDSRLGEPTMTDHSNLFHEALVKVHDITTNKPLNMRSWQDVHDVDKALEEARRNDRAEQSRK